MNPKNIISVFLVLFIIFFEILTALKNKDKTLLAIPMITWMLHSLLFYFMSSRIDDKLFVNSWSQSLRMHGYLILASLSIYRFRRHHRGED